MSEKGLNQRSFRVKVKIAYGDTLRVNDAMLVKCQVGWKTPDVDYILIITEDPDGPFVVFNENSRSHPGIFTGIRERTLGHYLRSYMCFLPKYFIGKNVRREVIILPVESKFHWTDFANIAPP